MVRDKHTPFSTDLIAAHAALTENVHGLPNAAPGLAIRRNATDTAWEAFDPATQAELDAGLATKQDAATAATDAELAAGLATKQDAATACTDAELTAHAALSEGVHGLPNAAALEGLRRNAADNAWEGFDVATQAELDAHTALNENVHGLPNAAALQALRRNAADNAWEGFDVATQAELDAHAATQPAHGGDLAGASRPPNGAAGGSLSGTYPNPHLAVPAASFPGSPVNGQVCTIIANSTNGVFWQFMYSTGNNWWYFIGGPPLYAQIVTDENRTNVAYGDLATVGPSITIPALGGTTGTYDIEQGANIYSATAAVAGFMSYAIGATAAVDGNAILTGQPSAGNTAHSSAMRKTRQTAIAPSTAFVSKYRCSAANAVNWRNRFMAITPVVIVP